MKRKLVIGLLFTAVLACSTSVTSCKTKEGCGLEDKYKENMKTKKRGKSNLFSKKQRKKL